MQRIMDQYLLALDLRQDKKPAALHAGNRGQRRRGDVLPRYGTLTRFQAEMLGRSEESPRIERSTCFPELVSQLPTMSRQAMEACEKKQTMQTCVDLRQA
jgi:hypothetical protein